MNFAPTSSGTALIFTSVFEALFSPKNNPQKTLLSNRAVGKLWVLRRRKDKVLNLFTYRTINSQFTRWNGKLYPVHQTDATPTGRNPIDRSKHGSFELVASASKVHLPVDKRGAPLGVVITGENRHDKTAAVNLIVSIVAERPVKEQYLCAYKAYDSADIRKFVTFASNTDCGNIPKQLN